MQINTPRLTLRPLSAEDKLPLLHLLTDEVVKQTYMVPDLRSEQDAEVLFDHLYTLSHAEPHFVVGIYHADKLIGLMNEMEYDGNTVELGYVIDPVWHNRGFATEALRAAIAHFFEQGLTQISAGAFEENAASIRVMQKSGMTRLERTEEITYRGKPHCCVYYAISNHRI